MSSLYVVDGNAVPFSSAKVTDVLTGSLGQAVPFNGGCIVNVPDWLTVTGVSDVFTPTTGLIDKKYAALFAKYPGFTEYAYDHLLDADHLDLTVAGTGGQFGSRGTNRVQGSVQSTVVVLAHTPSTAIVYWETYWITYDGTRPSEKLVEQYEERPASDLTCQVSFDGGSSFLAASSGGVLTIPVANQGSNLVVKFTGSARYLGGWAVIY